jgi:thiol-disulfide isomerase/thioredoxin
VPRRAEAVVTGGLIALAAALVVAAAVGTGWRATNGRMRPARPARAVSPAGRAGPGEPPGAARLTAADLGRPLGERATLLQFSSAFCAPCRATRVILADVAGRTAGVAHVEIDAESHLDLVRALDVRRTPTVFVLGADGGIVRRASGQPRKADVIGALGAALTPERSYSPGLETL